MAIKHRIKTRHGVFTEDLTRAKAIRQKCLDCSGWQNKDVRECPVKTCALWPYRMGSKPETIKEGDA